MNKKTTITLLIILVFCYLFFSLFPINTKKIEKQNQFINKFEQVEKMIPKSPGEYQIKEGQLLGSSNNNTVFKDITKGTWYQTESGLFGYIEYQNKCIQRKRIGANIVVEDKPCKILDTPHEAVKKIQKESSKIELIKEESEEHKKDYSSKYYFVGKNPNNYFVYQNKCFRIVSIAQNNDIKLVYENEVNKDGTCENITTNVSGNIGVYTWDYRKDIDGNWNELSSLHDTMYYWEKDGEINNKTFKMNLNGNKIRMAEWYVGEVSEKNTTIDDVEKDEIKDISKAKIGMLNSSDYLKVRCSNKDNMKENCTNDNYLTKEKYHWWTINSVKDEFKKVWIVMQNGKLESVPVLKSHEFYFSGVRLAIYLDGNSKIIGHGTEKEPYRLLEKE